MNNLNQFNIEFSGLEEGMYRYEFKIDKSLFDYFEYSELENANVHVVADMQRQKRMLVFNFSIEGSLNLTCDRCLENFDFQISSSQELFVKIEKSSYEESENTLVLSDSEHQINIAQYIYEYILLCVPAKVTHPNNEKGESTCNKAFLDMLKKFEPELKSKTDPRWESLKKLKDNNN